MVKKKGVKWVWDSDQSALELRKKIGPGALVKFTPARAKKEKRMLARIAVVHAWFDGDGPKKGQLLGVETKCDQAGKHDGTIRKKGQEPKQFFDGPAGACDFWKAKDVVEVLMTAEELATMKQSRDTFKQSKGLRQQQIVIGDYVAVNKQALGQVKAVEWIKRTGRTGEWLAVQVDCKIDRARSSDITEIFFTDPSTAEYLDKKIDGCWDPSNQELKNSQTVYPLSHGGESLPEGQTYPDAWTDQNFACQYLKQPYKWNFSDIVKQEDKYDKALKNLQNAVKAKIDLQREKLERTMREKVSFKRDQFEEEERILKMKIDERQETIDKYQLRLAKDLLMTVSQREDINKEVEKILADKGQMQQDLRRFQIHSEEECLLLHHDHSKHLRHEMTTALAADLKREVDRKKQRQSQRSGDLPKFKEEQEDEWDEPTDQALREVEILKAENAEVMKALQAIAGELGNVQKENQQILRKLKCIPADDVDDFQTPGGDYYKGQTGFSSDEEDPLGDLEDLMDLSGVRQNAINLVNTLIGDDGAGDEYGGGDTLGGYGDTPAGDDFGAGGDYHFGDTGAGNFDDIDDLLRDYDADKGLNDDDW